MNDSNDLLRERFKKYEAILAMGVHPFGGRFEKACFIAELVQNFEDKKKVKTAGRLSALRVMGKTTFCDLKDESGRVQLYVKHEHLGDQGAALFGNLDIGDLVGVEGELFKTKTGEISIRADELHLLSKSLRPMPEKWHGLKDVELRYRQRYLDLISNDETKQIFKKRSLIIRSIRKTLDDKGYLEVETPMMHPIPGGAAGKPFKTHHEALDLDLYLRVAPELYLKKLLVGGFDKVYEVNKSFRNEGISTRHNPEFTMLEVYTAYQDVNDVMALTEEIVKKAAQDVLGTLVIGSGVDLTKWERISFADLMRGEYGIGPEDETKAWIEKLKKKGVKIEGKDLSRTQLINIVGELITPLTLPSPQRGEGNSWATPSPQRGEGRGEGEKIHPIFVTDYFTELCPLAKKNPKNPALSERFELYLGGMEIANGYSELNNPIEQRERFLEELKEKGKENTYETVDEDFLTALEYGMPPAGGLGIGVDRLVMALTNQNSIREVILFPQMKPEK
jgi:lysyl-tRNA synthetase, class II